MDINMTLIVQMLVFAAFVWFTMKLVWPPLEQALESRKEKIAEGLSAAERGKKELELAQHRINDDLKQAKAQAAEIIDKANKRAYQIVEDAKDTAIAEAKAQARIAHEQLQFEVNQAKEHLRKQVASLAVAGAEKILSKEIDKSTNSLIVNNLIEEI